MRSPIGRVARKGITEIAMESTGVYWRPVWNVLEGHGFELILANPQQVKALHGRKSDQWDCERIAQFARDRRLDPSFVPPPEIRRLRELLRYRVSLWEQRNETHNKIRDLLETANIKLSSVVTDLLGVTGQRIVEALIAGETSPDKLSWKVKGSLRKKEKEVRQSMAGCFDEFHPRDAGDVVGAIPVSERSDRGGGGTHAAVDGALGAGTK